MLGFYVPIPGLRRNVSGELLDIKIVVKTKGTKFAAKPALFDPPPAAFHKARLGAIDPNYPSP